VSETRLLAEWVAATRLNDVPGDVRETMRILLLDDLASGFAGARTRWCDAVADMARSSAVGACSVFGRSWTTSSSHAALVNGVAVGGFETDHPYTQGNCHPSGAVFPAVLAIAEQERLDGETFFTALTLGYEALCRIGSAATRAVEDERGFHGPGTNAPLGAAIACGKALGFSVDLLVNAMGIAGSHGSGLLEFFRDGSMTKRLHLGRGSQMGLECALLARNGFTGPSTVIEGERGFLNVYSPSPRLDLLLDGLGTRYHIPAITVKAYPCHVSFHAVVDAIQRFRRSHDLDPASIQHVSISSPTRMMEARFAARRPTTLLGAQYSLPWSSALALWRDVEDPSAWTEADLNHPGIQKLAAEMELHEEHIASSDAVAEITVTTARGDQILVATDWKGAPTNPYSFEEMAAKLRRYAGPEVDTDAIIQAIASIERLADVSDLARLIRGQ
jgi:2-methylcitrate dehydratase PrpD